MAYPAKNNYAPAHKQSGVSKFFEFLTIALVIGLIVAGIAMCVSLCTPNTGVTEVKPSYIAGSVGELAGEYVLVDDSEAIITEDLIKCTSFTVTPKFTSVVNYKVHFWGPDSVYIGYVEGSTEAYSLRSADDMPCLKLDESGNPIYNLYSDAYNDATAADDAPVAIGFRVEIRPNAATPGFFNNDWYDITNYFTKKAFSDDMVITITQKK